MKGRRRKTADAIAYYGTLFLIILTIPGIICAFAVTAMDPPARLTEEYADAGSSENTGVKVPAGENASLIYAADAAEPANEPEEPEAGGEKAETEMPGDTEGAHAEEMQAITEDVPEKRPETADCGRYAAVDITDSDLKLMARIVYLEAGGECMEGQQAVAEVILNRVLDPRFPDSVRDVIYDNKYGVQFVTAAYAGTAEPGQAQFEAIEKAVYGENILDADVIYFSTAPQTDDIRAVIGGHYFCA